MTFARSLATLLLCVGFFASSAPAFSSDVKLRNILEDMSAWWNEAYRTPGGFTVETFSQYYTHDAVMRINGKVTVRGLEDMASRFQGIQKNTDLVEMIVPFEETFVSEDGKKIFTYHLIRSRTAGQDAERVGQVMGYATIRDGKISVIDFVSIGDPQQDSLDK